MSEIQKPRFTEPCNYCGLCCRQSLCDGGEIMHPKHVAGPCPSLIVHDGTQRMSHRHRWTRLAKCKQTGKICDCGALKWWNGQRWEIAQRAGQTKRLTFEI